MSTTLVVIYKCGIVDISCVVLDKKASDRVCATPALGKSITLILLFSEQ